MEMNSYRQNTCSMAHNYMEVYTVNVHMNVPECTHEIIPRTKSELNRCAQMLEDLNYGIPLKAGITQMCTH